MIAEHFPHEAKDIPYESLFQAANDIMAIFAQSPEKVKIRKL